MANYIHGYSNHESKRLTDQAETLSSLLHDDSFWPEGSNVLEVGCGTGAQTITLANQNPHVRFVSIDHSIDSLKQAEERIKASRVDNVTFTQADIFNLPFEENSFDHIFICFVLEHLPDPVKALSILRRILKPGGTITVIEGDHGSFFCHPKRENIQKVIQSFARLQSDHGGNGLIGRELYPLLNDAAFGQIKVSPRIVYADGGQPNLANNFINKTFTPMIMKAKQSVIAQGWMDENRWNQGIKALKQTVNTNGTFSYTFFRGKAIKY